MTKPKLNGHNPEQAMVIKERALALLKKKAAESLDNLRFHREGLQVEQAAEMTENLQNAAAREVELGRLDQESQQMALVRQAIEAAQQGTYGECRDCGEEIAPRRLEALPWAIRCVHCQERYELLASADAEKSTGWNTQASAA